MKQQTTNLGTEKIPILLRNLSIPAFMAMFVSGLFNIVDTIFIARGIGTLGVAGLSIAFPIQMILAALVISIGIGGSLIISQLLGQQNTKEANDVFGHIVWLLICISFFVAVIAALFLEPILVLFGASKTVLPYAYDYLSIVLIGSVFISFAAGTNNVVRAEGSAKVAMLTMILSALLNVILNPIFIFGLQMGMKGTAIATVISQVFAAIWLIVYFKRDSSLKLSWIGFLPKWSMLKEIIQLGVPAFVQNVSTSILLVIVNWMLVLYGSDTHVAIFGIVNRLMMFMTMPIYGVVQGMQPILGYNFGAHLYDRVSQTIKLSILVTTIIATGIWIVMMLFPELFMRIFTTDPSMIDGGIESLRFVFLLTPLMGFPMVASGLYQSLASAKKAFILSLSNLLFLTPSLLLFPYWFGLYGVWTAFPVSYLFGFLLAVFIVYRDRHMLFHQKVKKA